MHSIRAHAYVVTAAASALPISVVEARAQCKLGSDIDADLDAELLRYINAAVPAAERFVRRDFITRTYLTYRDRFAADIEIRRNPFQSVVSIKYYKSGVLVTVEPTTYYNTVEPDGYSKICLVEGQSWPTDVDVRHQAVQISFKCGYGDAAANVPAPLREGMLQHVAQLWTHRGDNDGMATSPDSAKPPAIACNLFNKYRILEID